ncbi:MAG: DUF3299 domain-containing protein [Elusimicrobia bacterium]|nr:DUF3299 domain-containing protein [Elusimicrobiota bacterium]
MKNKIVAAFGAAVFLLLAIPEGGTAEVSSPAEKVGFDVLGGFDYVGQSTGPNGREVTGTIPEAVRALNGRRVEVVGYVMPIDIDDKGIRSFALIKDQASCCFGQTPRINHWIYVTSRGDPFGRLILSRNESSEL